ncbi:MAG: hypothetical protein KatS3mg105_3759 [Gemmatales bacterium]|nr:MAG: hypothetical protein KatS3mg105_3759 [Gemmatales bacterium]
MAQPSADDRTEQDNALGAKSNSPHRMIEEECKRHLEAALQGFLQAIVDEWRLAFAQAVRSFSQRVESLPFPQLDWKTRGCQSDGTPLAGNEAANIDAQAPVANVDEGKGQNHDDQATMVARSSSPKTAVVPKARATMLSTAAPTQSEWKLASEAGSVGGKEPRSRLADDLMVRAEEHRRRGEHAQALARYDDVIKLAPFCQRAYVRRGQLLRSLGRRKQALADLTRACELAPDDAEAALGRGNILFDLGNYDEAIACYSRAIELDSGQPLFYLNRALAYARKRAFIPAIEDAGHALRLDGELGDAYYLRGFALHRCRRFDEALADFDRLLAIRPGDALAWNERGLVYASRRQYAEAIRDYGQALKRDPQLVLSRYNRGIAYRLSGEYAMARADFEEVLRRKPDFYPAYLQRGLCFAAEKDFDNALADLHRAAELAPGHQEIIAQIEEVRAASKTHQQSTTSSWATGLLEKSDSSAKLVAVTCPECGAPGKIPWEKLQAKFECKHCRSVYSVEPNGKLARIGRIENNVLKPAPTRAFDIRAIRLRYWAAGAVLLALLYPISTVCGTKPPAVWRSFDISQLCALWREQPASVRDLPVEVSGTVQRCEPLAEEPTLVLGLPDGSRQIVCQLDSYALANKKALPDVQAGTYVIVQGKLGKAEDGQIKVLNAWIAMIDKNPLRSPGIALGPLFVKK